MEQLKLPKHLSPNAMLEVLNALFSYEDLAAAVQKSGTGKEKEEK